MKRGMMMIRVRYGWKAGMHFRGSPFTVQRFRVERTKEKRISNKEHRLKI